MVDCKRCTGRRGRKLICRSGDLQEATNSHDFDRKDDGVHETWTDMNTDPDWSQYQ